MSGIVGGIGGVVVNRLIEVTVLGSLFWGEIDDRRECISDGGC